MIDKQRQIDKWIEKKIDRQMIYKEKDRQMNNPLECPCRATKTVKNCLFSVTM